MANQNSKETPVLYVSLLRKGTNDIDVDLVDSVTAFKYTDSDKKTDKCVFTVRNNDLSNFDKPLWKKGAKLRVRWGFYGAMSPARVVVIESVKGFTTLSVEAHGLDVLMNKTKKPNVYRNVQRSELVHALASDYGFDLKHRFIQETTKVYPQISQAGQTDAQLIAKLAKKEGFVFYVDFDGFHWHERDLAQAPHRRYVYGAAVQISEMVIGSPAIENDITVPRYKGVRRKNVDKETGEPFDELASNTETKRDGLAPILDNMEDVSIADLDLSSMEGELAKLGNFDEAGEGGGEDGGWISDLISQGTKKAVKGVRAIQEMQAPLDGSASYNPDPILYSDPNGSDYTDPDASANYHYVEVVDPRDKSTSLMLEGEGFNPIDEGGSSASDAEEAKTDADAKYKKAQLVAVKLKFDVYGDAHLLAKTVVRFDAWGQTPSGPVLSKRISGLYYVSEVEHDLGRGNYVCHLTTHTDGGGSNGGAKTKSGSDANLNKDTGGDGSNPVGELKAFEEVDPDTRERTLLWTDSHGQRWSSMEEQTTDLPTDQSFGG